MERMTVHWQKRTDYPFLGWCHLNSDLLDDPRLEICFSGDRYRRGICVRITGVYIIWAGTDNRTILKVGSGIIKDRLREHFNDPTVQAYKYRGLYATWASFLFVDKSLEKQRGVERFLGGLLNPKLGERFPDNVDPIWVNLPVWDEPSDMLLRALSGRNQRDYIQPNKPIPFRNR